MIDPEDVGNVGAHLLALDDPTSHNQARYVLSGPEDVTGKRIVEMAEQILDVKMQKVEFEDTSVFGDLVKAGVYPEKLLSSMLAGCQYLWQNKCSLGGTPTSKVAMGLAPPKRTVLDALKIMLED
jgi:nucleoside-diphosphate-sugar epimerase